MIPLFGLLILAGQGGNFRLQIFTQKDILSDMLYRCASSNNMTAFSNISEADAGLLLVQYYCSF